MTSIPKLDVRDLQVVLAIAASGSTVKAAAKLYVTQSAVSRGLALAEEKLDLRLFDRTRRGLVPTAAGARLIDGAGTVLAQMVALEQQASAATVGRTRVRVVCECYTAYRWLPSTLEALGRRLPSLDIALAPEHTRAPVAALRAGEVDIALLTTAGVHTPLLEMPLFADEIVFVVARAHPLASRGSITARDLLQHSLIVSTSTPEAEQRWFATRVFGGARPKVRFLRFPLTEAIVDAARAGMGIAVLSEWIASPYLGNGDLALVRLRGRRLERPWRMAFRRDAAAGAELLAAALQNAAPKAYATGS